MPELGKYAFHVLASYLATGIGLGGLIALTLWRSRNVARALAEAEALAPKGGRNG